MADLAHATENDTDLMGDLDARHWAERFVARVAEYPGIPTDEGAMLAWFAGCIEGTRDAARAQILAELGNDHYVTFTPTRWVIEHSAQCRLSGAMAECEYHAAVETAEEDDVILPVSGRWRITALNAAGPVLERAEVSRA